VESDTAAVVEGEEVLADVPGGAVVAVGAEVTVVTPVGSVRPVVVAPDELVQAAAAIASAAIESERRVIAAA